MLQINFVFSVTSKVKPQIPFGNDKQNYSHSIVPGGFDVMS